MLSLKITLIAFAAAFASLTSSFAKAQSSDFDSSLELTAPTADFTVELQKLVSSDGFVDISIFNNPNGFPDKATPIKMIHVPAHEGTMQVHVGALPAGVYALTVLHDDNGDGQMDYNFLGIPTKGFGFSNNPHIQLSAPTFQDCRITIGAPATKTTIVMIHY